MAGSRTKKSYGDLKEIWGLPRDTLSLVGEHSHSKYLTKPNRSKEGLGYSYRWSCGLPRAISATREDNGMAYGPLGSVVFPIATRRIQIDSSGGSQCSGR